MCRAELSGKITNALCHASWYVEFCHGLLLQQHFVLAPSLVLRHVLCCRIDVAYRFKEEVAVLERMIGLGDIVRKAGLPTFICLQVGCMTLRFAGDITLVVTSCTLFCHWLHPTLLLMVTPCYVAGRTTCCCWSHNLLLLVTQLAAVGHTLSCCWLHNLLSVAHPLLSHCLLHRPHSALPLDPPRATICQFLCCHWSHLLCHRPQLVLSLHTFCCH